MSRVKRIVQGAFIPLEIQRAIAREAQRKEIAPATLAAEILEREGKKILKQESKMLKGE